MAATIRPDDTTPGAMAANTVALSSAAVAGGELPLPAGTTNHAGWIVTPSPKGVRIEGDANGLSAVRCGSGNQWYWANNSLSALGTGIGWADAINKVLGTTALLVPGVDMSPYQRGTLCHAFGPGVQPAIMRVANVNGNAVAFTVAPPTGVQFLKWYVLGSASAIPGKPQGAVQLFVSSGNWPVGSPVFVTGGPMMNEAVGEWRVVADYSSRILTLDRPLRRTYGNAVVVVPASPVSGLTVWGVRFAQPLVPNADAASIKFAVGVRFMDCTFDTGVWVTSSANIRFDRCHIAALMMNSSHDITAADCTFGSVAMEEGCRDVLIRDFRIDTNGENGVRIDDVYPSERIKFVRGIITGATSSPIYGAGNLCEYKDIETTGGGISRFSGNGCLLSNYTTESPLGIDGGHDWKVLGCRMPYGSGAAAGTTGLELGGDRDSTGQPMFKVPPGWRQW